MSDIRETHIRETLQRNLDCVRRRMAEAIARSGKGRAPDAVRLVAVTKTVGADIVRILHEVGATDFENRVEGAREKIVAAPAPARWHMIGPVQRRKARDIVALFDTVDSIDRLEVAEALQRRCEEQDRRIRALVEVNVSAEASKHGFSPESLDDALAAMAGLNRLHIEGLMTMAPFNAPETVLRSVFGRLRELAESHNLQEISMGMSDDYEIAIEEGSTQVRIGRALFEGI